MTDRGGGSSAWGPSFHPPPSQVVSLRPHPHGDHLPTRATHHRRRHVPVGPAGLWFQQEQRGGGAAPTLEKHRQGGSDDNNHEEEEEDVRVPVTAVPTETRKSTTTTLSPAWIKMQCDLGIVTPALPAYWNPSRKACTLRKEPCSYPSRYALLTDILYPSSSEQLSRSHPWKVTKPVLVRVHAVSARLGDSALWVLTLVDDETGARMSAWMEPAWVAREQQQPSILQEGFVWLLVGATLLLVDPESTSSSTGENGEDDDEHNHHLERLLLVTPENVIQSWSPHELVDDATYIRWMEGRAALTSQIPQEPHENDAVADGDEEETNVGQNAETDEREHQANTQQFVPRVASLHPPNQQNTAARSATQLGSQPIPFISSRRKGETSVVPGVSASKNSYARLSSTGHTLAVSGRHQSHESSVATILMLQSQPTMSSPAGISAEQQVAQTSLHALSAIPPRQEPTSRISSSVAAGLIQQSQSSVNSSHRLTTSPQLVESVLLQRESDPRRNMTILPESQVADELRQADALPTVTTSIQRPVSSTEAQPPFPTTHGSILSQAGGHGQAANMFSQFASPTQDARPAPSSNTQTKGDKENVGNVCRKKRPRSTQPPKALWMSNDAALLALSDDDDDDNPPDDDNADRETLGVKATHKDASHQSSNLEEPPRETNTPNTSQPNVSLFQATEFGALDLSLDDDDDDE